MIDPTPWIVCENGPKVPAGVLRSTCLRCGDTNDTALPISALALLPLMDAFKARHRRCKEPTNPGPAPVTKDVP